MAKRRSREQWEQDVRDAQKNITWDDEQRALGAIIRNSPKDGGTFSTWRELASFVVSCLLLIGGAMLLILAWNWATHVNQLPWSVFGRYALIAAIAVAGCMFFWLGVKLFRKSLN